MTAAESLRYLEQDSILMDKMFEQVVKASRRYKRSLIKELAALMTLDEFGYNPQSLAVLSNVMYQLPYIMAGVISSDLNAAYMAVVNRRLSTVNRLMTQLELFGGVLNNPGMVGNVPARIASMQMAIGDGIGRGQLKIDEEIREYIRRMQSGEMVTRRQLIDALEAKAGVAPQYAGTIANTELAAIDREIRLVQTQAAGLSLMRYTGPVDRITREFCLENLGRIESLNYWEMLQNPTGPNPASVYCGGFNCRHRLLPWDMAWGIE